jgi:polyphosphate kinase
VLEEPETRGYVEQPSAPPSPVEPQYLNRELSWLQFNQRVLEEALKSETPLLERVRFLAIFTNNLDEFFMVRISGLFGQLSGGAVEVPPDGLTPLQQILALRESLTDDLARAEVCWRNELLPELIAQKIRLCEYIELNKRQTQALRDYYTREVFPVLTPLAFDPSHPFPHISNLSLNLAVVVNDEKGKESFARVKVPDSLPRLVPIPGEGTIGVLDDIETPGAGGNFVWLEELIAANLDTLFPGLEIVDAYSFRITRDADFDVKDEGTLDLLTNLEQLVELRQWGSVIRMELDQRTPDRIRGILMRNLELAPYQVYQTTEHLGFASLMELTRIDRPELKFPPFVPNVPSALTRKESIFDLITDEGLLLYHPYDSFAPVVEFIREAANDPNVLAIKQTLYRVGSNSPIVEALTEARQNGKQVAVLLELQARFDEESNIAWARALEDEGVHVVYGVLGLKTHAKMTMVVRREDAGLRRYVHLSTGNYNTVTSRIYTDLSYFTCNQEIVADVADLFNALTGYSRQESFTRLLVAPGSLRPRMLELIEREAKRQRSHGDGYLLFKMNSLVDKECIAALCRASQAGVRIDLQIRGMCCLKPGVPGLSDNIRVTSIVGRFLEHARIYYFRNGGADEILVGSADLMERNLDRRVEVLFPIKSQRLRERIVKEILEVHLRDTKQASVLLPDGTYQHIQPPAGEQPFGSQEWLMEHWRRVE